jgi:hypothetical protein
LKRWFLAFAFSGAIASSCLGGVKVAFIGDQGLGLNSLAVLQLIKQEGAEALIHLGDFDYVDNPTAWESQTDTILGADFPQFAIIGNHDIWQWQGDFGYQRKIQNRLERLGIDYSGVAGAQYSFHFKEVFFILTSPSLTGGNHAEFIQEQLAKDSSIFCVSGWHVNQMLMQVGGKGNEAGWGVYEASLAGGAIVATAHEHSYSRTHLLKTMNPPTMAPFSEGFRIRRGRTFAFVSGLGGGAIRPQYRNDPWWAAVYTSNQNASHGAFFAEFGVDGNPRQADFYFKDIQGKIPDQFTAYSDRGLEPPPPVLPPPPPKNPGPEKVPKAPRQVILDPVGLGFPSQSQLSIMGLSGRRIPYIRNQKSGMLTVEMTSGSVLVIKSETGKSRKVVILP